jgi:hypothetical protein
MEFYCKANKKCTFFTPPPPTPPSQTVPKATYFTLLVIWKVHNCPRSKISDLNGIWSCAYKLHGAPGCETGPFGPILAALSTCTCLTNVFSYKTVCCVKKINELSFFLSVMLLLFLIWVGFQQRYKLCIIKYHQKWKILQLFLNTDIMYTEENISK